MDHLHFLPRHRGFYAVKNTAKLCSVCWQPHVVGGVLCRQCLLYAHSECGDLKPVWGPPVDYGMPPHDFRCQSCLEEEVLG